MVAARRPQPRRPAVAVPPPETGPYALVWRRLRRLPIDARNEVPTIEVGADDTVAIDCGGRPHTAQVRGELVLDDHDVEAELAMLALGAALPACLVYLAVWHHALGDPAFLLAWGDDVEVEGLRTAREDWEGNYWESWPAEPPGGRVLFGPRLQRTLAVAAAERAAGEAGGDRFEGWQALQRATQTRARRAFVRSLASVDAHPRPDALVPVRIRLDPSVPRGAATGRLARLGSAVDLVLPVDWLWTVWPAALSPDGRFVLSRTRETAAVVRWERTGGPEREHAPVVVDEPGRPQPGA